ncbi:MAG: CoB--CoM heterodisulfide reductase iron-sulfur subunit B family protein [Clostridia bacterium]|nr:CoB--CoM heterodisulfide reductase iron-sulfur subunit B family protein [Clostridia bacterium]
MKVSYYPGCTLKTKAKDLDFYLRKCAEALGVEVEEIENWQCCGGVFTTSNDEIATKLSSVRALSEARDKGQKLLTVCSACHNVIKQTNYQIKNDADFAARANNYMQQEVPYEGEAEVIHFLELLRDEIGFDAIKEKATDALKDKKIAAYYGCLLLRPGKVMQLDDAENPTVMEQLIEAMGATPVVSPYRNECCGGYVVLDDAKSAEKKSTAITENAKQMGADMIVTACPLCKYNLEKHDNSIPVVYITELLAEALGIKEGAK